MAALTPISIADSQIALVLVAKDAIPRRRIRKAVSEYLRRDLMVQGANDNQTTYSSR